VVSLIFFNLLMTVEVGGAVRVLRQWSAALWRRAARGGADPRGILARFRRVPGRLRRIGGSHRPMEWQRSVITLTAERGGSAGTAADFLRNSAIPGPVVRA